jgi:hypothetical protein
MFGPNWDQTIAPNAFANGYLGVEDIAEGSAAMKAFESYRLVAQDGITEAELQTIATAKRHLAIFLGGSLEAGAVKESDVNGAIDQIFALAEKGELTRDKLNELLAPFGIKFTRAAFAQIFAGGGEEGGVLPVCKALEDMFLTAVFVNNGNEYDAADLLDPDKEIELMQKGVRRETLLAGVAETFKQYAGSNDFFVIKVGKFSELYQGALASRYGLDPTLPPAKLMEELHDNENIPEWLKEQIAAIKDKEGLTDTEKWNQLTLAMLGRVFGKLRETPNSSRQEAEVAKLKSFQALVEKVQAEKASPLVRNAFIAELTTVVLDGKRQVFEWSPIVRGKGVVRAIPGAAPTEPVATEGGD